MAKRGRPSKFSKAIADEICRRLADGESLRTICAEDAMPDKDTVRRWLRDEVSADFHAQYARAREEQADSLAEEAIDAARAAVDRDTAAAAKVQVDALFKYAGQLKPKVYGDKREISHKGTVEHAHSTTEDLIERLSNIAARNSASTGVQPTRVGVSSNGFDHRQNGVGKH